MKWMLLFVLTVAVSGTLHAQTSSDKERFLQKAHSCHMEFSDIAGYREVKVDTAIDVRYDYSLSDPRGSYEIRYKITPSPGGTDTTAAAKEDGKNMFYKTSLTAICFDIAHSPNISYQPFPREYMRASMNADMGGRSLLKGASRFSKGFQHVYLLTFFNKNAGLIYVFYLFNGLDTAALGKVVKETANLLKFSVAPEIPAPATVPGERSAAQMQRLEEFYIDSLQVTPVQADSLAVINERYAAWGHAVKLDNSLSKKDKINKLLELVRQKDDATRKVLSPDQYNKWIEMRHGRKLFQPAVTELF